MTLRYSLITSSNPNRLTKRFDLGAAGEAQKSNAGNMIAGSVEHASARDLPELSLQLDALAPNQASVWGLSRKPAAPIAMKRDRPAHPDAIARQREDFYFDNGPGVMMLDHDDVRPGMPPLSANDLLGLLFAACPALAAAPMLVRPSASAGIAGPNGVLNPLDRWRAYIAVSNAADIPEAGARLMTLLWAAGLAWHWVDDKGVVRKRAILDGSVWLPERFDFCARAVLGPGLSHVHCPPLLRNVDAPLFDLARIAVDDATVDLAAANRVRDRAGVEPLRQQARAQYVATEAPRMAERGGIPLAQAETTLAASTDGVLIGQFPLRLHDGRDVTVEDLLTHVDEFEGVEMHDPLEPGYSNSDSRIAIAYLREGLPIIYSHAHGGQQHRLLRDPTKVGFGTGPVPPGMLKHPLASAVDAEIVKRRLVHEAAPYGVNAADPLGSARALVALNYQHADGHRLKAWQDAFYRWDGARWVEMSTADIRAVAYDFIDKVGAAHFRPNQSRVSNLIDALKAAVNLDSSHQPPGWIAGPASAPPHELVACANGLLHLPTRRMLPATPRFFNMNAVPFAFDPHAAVPAHWLQFLGQVWPDDSEAVGTLQEVFGYLLTPDTSQQKLFLIVGPKRSGKGTIGRVLTAVVGAANVAGPSLGSMTKDFGLQPLLGKQLALVSDARLGSGPDAKLVAENLLRISGEDQVDVNRKGQTAVSVRLGVRFVLLTNELPRIADASGAMASRFVILTMGQSFYGREDPGLSVKLLAELPGIFAWAAEGWHRLRQRGYFIEPKSSIDAVRELADLGSPIGAFVRDECEREPGAEVEIAALFGHWRMWCAAQGRQHAGDAASFGRDLRAAHPEIEMVQRRTDKGRLRFYRGIRLQADALARMVPPFGR
jgi:putative DNA primase/helicase